MSDNDNIKALEELAAAIARLEDRLTIKAQASIANDALIHKHAALKSDIAAIIRDLDNMIGGAQRG